MANITEVIEKINGYHDVFSTNFYPMNLPYAVTYNCLVDGGEQIQISGRNFGNSETIVLINNKPCEQIEYTQIEKELRCTLPAGTRGQALVAVINAQYQGLRFERQMLAYAGELRMPSY